MNTFIKDKIDGVKLVSFFRKDFSTRISKLINLGVFVLPFISL